MNTSPSRSRFKASMAASVKPSQPLPWCEAAMACWTVSTLLSSSTPRSDQGVRQPWSGARKPRSRWISLNMFCSEGGGGTPYTIINVGEGTGGGMLKNPIPNAPSMWMPYVLVDDLDATATTAVALGGSIMMEKTEVKNMGTFIIVKDPVGSMVGFWKSLMG